MQPQPPTTSRPSASCGGRRGRSLPIRASLFLGAALLGFVVAAAPGRASGTIGGDYPWGSCIDGEPALGPKPDVREVETLFRKPRPADEPKLRALFDLGREVEVWLALGRAVDRQRGLDDLLAGSLLLEDPELKLRLLGDAPLRRPWTPQEALALARLSMNEDRALWVRFAADAEVELRELRSAIAVIVSHTFGAGLLRDGAEIERIVGRADLAATRLRAVLTDLEALAPSPGVPLPRDSVDVLRVASGLARRDPDAAREFTFHRAEAQRRAEERRSSSALAATEEALAGAIEARAEGQRIANANYALVYDLHPDFDPYRKVATDIAALSRSERYRRCLELLDEGLDGDPFHEQLCFSKALVVDFASGKDVSIPWFDRFLALRGYPYFVHTTERLHYLDPQDRFAIFRVRDEPAIYAPPDDD